MRNDGTIGIRLLLTRQAGRRLLHDRAVDIAHARKDAVGLLLPLQIGAKVDDRAQRVLAERVRIGIRNARKLAAAQQHACAYLASVHRRQAAEVARVRRTAQQIALRDQRVSFHFAVLPPRLGLSSCP